MLFLTLEFISESYMIKQSERQDELNNAFNFNASSNPFFTSPASEIFYSGDDAGMNSAEGCKLCNSPCESSDSRSWSCGHQHHPECADAMRPYFAVSASLCPVCRGPAMTSTDVLHDKAARRYFGLERKVYSIIITSRHSY